MKQILQTLTAGFAMMLGAGAHATVVKYAYEAKVTSVSEFDSATQTYIYPQQSAFADKSVAIGNVIKGFFEYDTSAKLSTYQPPQEPGSKYMAYDLEAGRINYVDQATGLAFDSSAIISPGSIFSIGSIFVQDSLPIVEGYASDFFSMFQHVWYGDAKVESNIWLDDVYGHAFSESTLPVKLDLAAFQFAHIESTYASSMSGNRISFFADLTSLQRTEVPEPASAFLFAIAGAALIGAKRRRH